MKNNLSWVIWHLTNFCNLECKYCFTNSSPISKRTLEEKDLLEITEKIKKSDARLMTLIGGEPLVVESLPKIVENLLGKDGLKVNLDTNGVLLKDRWNSVYEKFNRINVSIDSVEEKTHNSQRSKFYSVFNAINFLSEKNVEFGNTITVTSRNIGSLEKTAEFLLEKGSSSIGFSRMKPIGRGELDYKLSSLSLQEEKEAIEKILNFYEKNNEKDVQIATEGFYDVKLFEKGLINKFPSCLCGDAKVTVSYDGVVYPCESLPFVDNKKIEFHPLNLLEYDFDEVMSDWQMVKWKEKTYNRPEECNDCTFQLYCNSGCQLINQLFTGENSKDIYCHLNEKFQNIL